MGVLVKGNKESFLETDRISNGLEQSTPRPNGRVVVDAVKR